MTTRSDYTDAEWDLLTSLPRMAALGAMAAEEGGPLTATRELWASMMEMGWKPNSGEDLGEAIVEKTLATAPRVREVLVSQATPAEAAEYTAWVLGIARAGVHAAGGGLFGMGGQPVTAAEDRYIKDLAAALGAE